MPTTNPYKALEARIKKGDVDALLARWDFGRKLLVERGDAKQLPHGFAAELHKNLDTGVQVSAYQRELSRRMRFAEQYPSEAAVRAAFKEFGSWHNISARGLLARDVIEAVAKSDGSVLQPPRYSSSFPFVRQYYKVLGLIRGHMRNRSIAYQALWLAALQHGIEQEVNEVERRHRAETTEKDSGLLKFTPTAS